MIRRTFIVKALKKIELYLHLAKFGDRSDGGESDPAENRLGKNHGEAVVVVVVVGGAVVMSVAMASELCNITEDL